MRVRRRALAGAAACGGLLLAVPAVAGAAANVSVTQRVTPASPIALGEDVRIRIGIANAGPDAAESVTLRDDLPAALALVSARTRSGSCTGDDVVRCRLGTLRSGDTASVNLVVRPVEQGALANTATVASASDDPVTSDNSAVMPITIDTEAAACATALAGSARRDVLRGTDRGDEIFGGRGNDTIRGLLGVDCLFGERGSDRIDGGGAADRLAGGASNDVLAGGSGSDELFGGDGADRGSGGSGEDEVSGGAGEDRLFGGAGEDVLEGGAGADRLSGGPGPDGLTGGPDADRLAGGAGDDTLDGGSGQNRLTGGAGNDTLFARNGRPDVVSCGAGAGDFARVDSSDSVTGCEDVMPPGPPGVGGEPPPPPGATLPPPSGGGGGGRGGPRRTCRRKRGRRYCLPTGGIDARAGRSSATLATGPVRR